MGRGEFRHHASTVSPPAMCLDVRVVGSSFRRYSTQAHATGSNASCGRCTHAGRRRGATQTTWAMAAWVRQQSPVKALALLIAATVIFRCDTVLLLAPVALLMLIRRQLAPTLLASVGQARGAAALVPAVVSGRRMGSLAGSVATLEAVRQPFGTS
jgi:hypothetical protein